MPIRYFAILSLLAGLLFCAAPQPLFEEYNTTLRTVNKNRATIDDSPLLAIGSSGIVIHRFENSEELIIARASVMAKDGTSALVELTPYDALAQNTFPKLAIIPKSGDKIMLNYLYDRALIVTPTSENFKQITDFFKNISWVHPDIAAAYLAKKFIPNPDKETFNELCKVNLAGLIAFNIENRGYFVDCVSFKAVKNFTLNEAASQDKAVLPFYSRISANIESSPLSLTSKSIGNYSEYYKNLLGLE